MHADVGAADPKGPHDTGVNVGLDVSAPATSSKVSSSKPSDLSCAVELMEWFAFDFPEKAKDAGVSRVWENGHWVDVAPDDWVYNCFAAIPMGWSWAMWIVQSIVSGVLRSVMLPGEPDLVEDRRPGRGR